MLTIHNALYLTLMLILEKGYLTVLVSCILQKLGKLGQCPKLHDYPNGRAGVKTEITQ